MMRSSGGGARVGAVRALTALSLCFGLLAADAAAATHTVVIDGVSFVPGTLAVKTGDTVVWVNKDPFAHTVTSAAGAFDSGEIAAGRSWRYTPSRAGEFAYTCTLHPAMKATLKVQ